MADKRNNPELNYILGKFPCESLDYSNMDHVVWLKNTAIDSSITGIIFICPKGKIIYANDAALKIWGWDHTTDLLGNYGAKFAQSWDRLADILDIVHKQGSWFGEIGTVRKDGSFNTVHLQATLIRNTKGDPICIMCSFVDVTEQKRLQKQMRIKDIAIEKSITGIVLTDLKGIITYANDATASMWGYERSEFPGKYAAKFAQSWEQIVEILNTILSEGFWIGEFGGLKKDGAFNIIHMSSSLIRDASDVPVCIMHSFVDVTEQKKMQEQMRIKDIAIEKSITGIILTDPKGIITYANDASASIWGYEQSEFPGKYAAKFAQSWEQIVDILNTVHRESFWKGEIVGVKKDGAFNIVHLSASLIRDSSNVPVCLMCSFVDVTEQKRLQEQMRIKECALKSSINGMAITDNDGNILYVNEAFYKMWGGVFPDEVIGKPVQNFAGSEKVTKKINKAVQRHNKWFGELTVMRRDKTTFDVQLFVNTISDPDQSPIHVLYAFVDISEQKKAERELKLSHEHLEMRVMERTEALQNLNHQNIKEIEERKQAEKLLRQKEMDLIKQSQVLEEMNIALKVLLKQREQDKEHLETDVFNNVEKNIFPYIKKLLNRKKIGVVEREYILTIEAHIKEIVSPFMRKLETTHQKLTPTEIMVANLIRDAKSTKEIAQLLDISIQTIEFHRKNIRQKLNLNHSKINLRSHLMSLN